MLQCMNTREQMKTIWEHVFLAWQAWRQLFSSPPHVAHKSPYLKQLKKLIRIFILSGATGQKATPAN